MSIAENRPWPPTPQGGQKYDLNLNLCWINTLQIKFSRKNVTVFIIPFLNITQKCCKVPKNMAIFMHNTQTGNCHPYKDTHQYEYSSHGTENEIPTVVYGKSKEFKNNQLKCQQFYYKCPKEVTLQKNINIKCFPVHRISILFQTRFFVAFLT